MAGELPLSYLVAKYDIWGKVKIGKLCQVVSSTVRLMAVPLAKMITKWYVFR